MKRFEIIGGVPLKGDIHVGGAKNVALKAALTGLLTDDEVVIHNIPHISDVHVMVDLIRSLGARASLSQHTLIVSGKGIDTTTIPLPQGAQLRTAVLALGPLLARYGNAKIPNPGGCRIGARPIDRHVQGLRQMGAQISYHSDDGYFYATAKKLHATNYTFAKNTHTGTETLILAAVLAAGETTLDNASAEPEVDNLIDLLNAMGARIKRVAQRTIVIDAVSRLHGCEFRIMPDRNEAVTYAIGAVATNGDVTVHGAEQAHLTAFLDKLRQAGVAYDLLDADRIRFFTSRLPIRAVDVQTAQYPGFMTDWQAPWTTLMTQAKGESMVHETVFEDRFSYVGQLRKLGADITFLNPTVKNPQELYNFNWEDNKSEYYHAICVKGPSRLHNAVLTISDLRAGATLVVAALVATGQSVVYGVDHIDRGYEDIEKRLTSIGARIRRGHDE